MVLVSSSNKERGSEVIVVNIDEGGAVDPDTLSRMGSPARRMVDLAEGEAVVVDAENDIGPHGPTADKDEPM